MRINRLLAFNQWPLVAKAMPPILRELYANPQLGFLGGQTSVYWRRVTMIQYWRSFDQLIAYAVGIWHETYQIAANQFECIYVNMPRFGLALGGTHEPAVGYLSDARPA